ncbi:MAG TPA: hypothetical protein VIH82_07145 [Acidimicrobiia bacterium]|jgi:hypothetical protein
MVKRAPWIALGAAAAWLLDGERGATRRAELASTLRAWSSGGAEHLDAPAPIAPPTAAR